MAIARNPMNPSQAADISARHFAQFARKVRAIIRELYSDTFVSRAAVDRCRALACLRAVRGRTSVRCDTSMRNAKSERRRRWCDRSCTEES